MKSALIVSTILIMALLITWRSFFPRDRFIILQMSGARSIIVSRTSVSSDSPPHHYATNAFDHIESYVERLLIPSPRYKSLSFFTPDGRQGFGLGAQDGNVQVMLSVECTNGLARETMIR